MGWYSYYQHLQMKEIRLSKLTWGEGNGNPLHNSCLGTLWTKEPGGLLSIRSHRVGHNWSDLACMHAMEKEMAIDATVLAWRISGREEPGELLSMGLHRVGHGWSDLAATAAAASLHDLLKVISSLHQSVESDSLWPHESQYARPPCPSPTPRVHPNSCPSSRWSHPSISSSVIPFSSCPQALPASESFPTSQLFAWGGQNIGVSTLASFLPKNTQDWSPLEWTGWISLQSKGLSRVFSNITVQKHQFFDAQPSSQSNSHIHTWPLEKP